MSRKTSKKWSEDIKTRVNNSKLNLLRVYDNTFVEKETVDLLFSHFLRETCHCDFCGQRIKYVSVLEFEKDTKKSHFQIGKECMSYLFDYGMKIEGASSARHAVESSVKKLIKKSTERSRAAKYKKELGNYISWLDSLDDNFIRRNSFLKFINRRLRTGDGVVTMKMMKALESMIERYTPKNTQDLNEKSKVLLGKIDTLLADVDAVYPTGDNGTRDFVLSVRRYVERNGNATQRQLEALNKVVIRIRKIKKVKAEKLMEKAFDKKKSTEYIPF